DMRKISRTQTWISEGANASSQRRAELRRRVSPMGWLVRFQCGKCSLFKWSCDQRICEYPFRSSNGSAWMGSGRMAAQWKSQRPRCNLRCRGRTGGDHACRRLRYAYGGADHRLDSRWILLLHGSEG